MKSESPIVTAEAVEVEQRSAILHGFVNIECLLTGGECGFVISTSPSPSFENGRRVLASEVDNNGNYCVRVSGLTAPAKYYYKAFLNTGRMNIMGDVKSITICGVIAAVDLGLSVKWANVNLGAENPENYGDYYAWGETVHKHETVHKLDYSWSTYKWCNGNFDKLTKYCPSVKTDYWDGTGLPDGKTVLDPEDDVAHMRLGGKWRMPTDEEWTELLENCTWSWTRIFNCTGRAGYVVTSKKPGYTDKSIFLPAAGYRFGAGLYCVGSRGYYWSSSLNTDYPDNAWYVRVGSSFVRRDDSGRGIGQSVRPVTEL